MKVQSALSNEISYKKVLKKQVKSDFNESCDVYKIELSPGFWIVIAVVKQQKIYEAQNLLFHYIYLIINKDKKELIGLYEYIPKYEDMYLNNEDGSLELEYLEGPILFMSVDDIKKKMENVALIEDIEIEEEMDEEVEKELMGEFEKEFGDDEFKNMEETKVMDEGIRQKYRSVNITEILWLKDFFENNNYEIIDPAGDGNCLFYTIRDAFKSKDKSVTVSFMRNKLSKLITKERFDAYMEQYKMFTTEIKNILKEQSKLKKEIKTKLKDSKKGSKNMNATQKKLIKEIEQIKMKMKQLVIEKKNATENLKDYKWINQHKIKNISDMQNFVKTSDFWADVWAINNLELILNVKMIILSSENYKNGSIENVLNCNEVSKTVEEAGVFNPKYYIIVEHTGNHYKLVTYKSNSLFMFHELPYSIVELVRNKCLSSKGKNMYSYIKKFKELQDGQENKSEAETDKETDKAIDNETEKEIQGVEDTKEPDDGDVVDEGDEGENEQDSSEEDGTPTPQVNDDELYDDNIVFQFSSRSKDAKPGKGAGESIPSEQVGKFNKLRNMKNWRRMLSNFYSLPKQKDEIRKLFTLDGLNWASVEHWYQANKFKENNNTFYKTFALNSGSEISKDPKMAKSAGGKSGKFKGKLIRQKTIKIDDGFFDNGYNEKVMEEGQFAKYAQNAKLKFMLLETKDAKLVHTAPRQREAVIFYDTMRIRNKLATSGK